VRATGHSSFAKFVRFMTSPENGIWCKEQLYLQYTLPVANRNQPW
jgi:hypothetical protein